MLAKSLSRLLLALLVTLNASLLTACLWDSDTRSMEEKAFPDALALITGGFLRHSPEFYEWRIEDRLAKIEKTPDKLELYDDLAVAYEKTGQTEKAIEVMQQIEARDPDRYETLANLGTFYIHHGELERGLAYINKALEVNPDAHFGRERYQKYVVEYVISKKAFDPSELPLDAESLRWRGGQAVGFTQFLFSQLSLETPQGADSVDPELKKQQDAEVKKATQGLLGMMRFGNHDSPILLECLGDLLIYGEEEDAHRQLASRSYLKASYELESSVVADGYLDLCYPAVGSIYSPAQGDSLEFPEFEKRFQEEMTAADGWVQTVFDDERKWIAEGVDVEQKYAEKYYSAPPPVPDVEEAYSGQGPTGPQEEKKLIQRAIFIAKILTFGLFLVILFAGLRILKYFRNNSQTTESPQSMIGKVLPQMKKE